MSPAQQEQLLNIGAYLQSIREEQSIGIDEVANQIFIRPALVEAIEKGDWKSLPEPIFVQGFIRRYADFLSLDGREISKQFESTPVSVLPDPKLASDNGTEGIVSKQDKHGLKVISKADAPKKNGPSRQPTQLKQKWLLGLPAIAVLIIGGIWVATQGMPQTTTTPDTSTESASPESTATSDEETSSAEEPEVADPSSGNTEATPAASETAANTPDDSAPITFQVNLEGDSWMRVIVDGEEAYEGILSRGTQRSWTAQNKLTVRAGNSGAVLYSFNGGEPLPLGEPGRIRDITLTPNTAPNTDPEELQTQ